MKHLLPILFLLGCTPDPEPPPDCFGKQTDICPTGAVEINDNVVLTEYDLFQEGDTLRAYAGITCVGQEPITNPTAMVVYMRDNKYPEPGERVGFFLLRNGLRQPLSATVSLLMDSTQAYQSPPIEHNAATLKGDAIHALSDIVIGGATGTEPGPCD